MASKDNEEPPSSLSKVANPTYSAIPYSPLGYRSFHEFYPFYLGEHSNVVCRRLHLTGTTVAVAIQLRILASFVPSILARLNFSKLATKLAALDILGGGKARAKLAAIAVVQTYAWAWIGHFFFEHNKPATFKHPFYSFIGDLKMWSEVMTCQRRF